MLTRLLFQLAKTALFGKAVGMGFEYFSGFIPVKKIRDTRFVLAFLHPAPAFENHILIVPKKRIRTLLDFHKNESISYFREIIDAAREIISTLDHYRSEFCICANGGVRQEVQQVHFHLFTGKTLAIGPISVPTTVIAKNDLLTAYEHPEQTWETHILIIPNESIPTRSLMKGWTDKSFDDLIGILLDLDAKLDLVGKGFTLAVQSLSNNEAENLEFQVIAGKRLSTV